MKKTLFTLIFACSIYFANAQADRFAKMSDTLQPIGKLITSWKVNQLLKPYVQLSPLTQQIGGIDVSSYIKSGTNVFVDDAVGNTSTLSTTSLTLSTTTGYGNITPGGVNFVAVSGGFGLNSNWLYANAADGSFSINSDSGGSSWFNGVTGNYFQYSGNGINGYNESGLNQFVLTPLEIIIKKGATARRLTFLNDNSGDNITNFFPDRPGQLATKGDIADSLTNKVSTIATIADLQAYSGSATTFLVTDSLRGGEFHYYASGGGFTVDNGINFTATGKGGGVMHRVVKDKWVYPEWWGAIPYDGGGAYTDAREAIQSAINSSTNKTSSVFIKNKFKYSGTIYLGQSTELEGSNVAFPKQYFGSDSLLYFIKNGLYHDNTGNTAAIKTTQEVSSYRPQFPSIKNLNIIGSNKNLDTAIVFSANINSTPVLKRVGLPSMENCYIDGFYTGVDCSNQGGDSFSAYKNHLSNLGGYGFRTGSVGETFGYFNDLFDIGVAGVESNGRGEVWIGNEMETGGVNSIGFLVNTAQRVSLTDNIFTNGKNAVVMKSTSSRITMRGGAVNNMTGNSVVIDGSLLSEVSGVRFSQGNEIMGGGLNFVYARQTTNPIIKNNIFSNLGGAITIPLRVDTCTFAVIEDNTDYGFVSAMDYAISANTTYRPKKTFGNTTHIGDVTGINGAAYVFQGGQSGTDIIRMKRVLGVTQEYGFSVGTGLNIIDRTTSNLQVIKLGLEGGFPFVVVGGDQVGTNAGKETGIRGENASGLNQNVGAFRIRAGRPTGNGTSGGISFQTPVLGSSGASLQAFAEKVNINEFGIDLKSGKFGINGSFGSAGQSLRNNSGNTALEYFTAAEVISATATLDFPNVLMNQNAVLTVTVTGASVGDVVTLGLPNSILSTMTAYNGTFQAWVSATNTVSIRFQNSDPMSAHDLASASFNIKILK